MSWIKHVEKHGYVTYFLLFDEIDGLLDEKISIFVSNLFNNLYVIRPT